MLGLAIRYHPVSNYTYGYTFHYSGRTQPCIQCTLYCCMYHSQRYTLKKTIDNLKLCLSNLRIITSIKYLELNVSKVQSIWVQCYNLYIILMSYSAAARCITRLLPMQLAPSMRYPVSHLVHVSTSVQVVQCELHTKMK